MNRRTFLRNTALLSTPVFFNGLPVFAGGGVADPLLQALAKGTNACNKVLVIIQLNGGNDGLNMVIPLDKYTELSNARSSLLIPSGSVLQLNNLGGSGTSTTTGLHPAMTGLRDMYNNGKVHLVQGVSYPNPNFSHFQAQDIWFSASNANQVLDTGWLGRELDTAYPGYPNGYPNAGAQDPLAVQIGGALPLSLQGPAINMGYNVPNPASLLNVVNNVPAPAPVSDYGTELTFLRQMKDQSNAYTSRITTAYNAQTTLSPMYATSGNSLSDQLKIVARLIGGGLTTQVYIVNHPDTFDTHVNQVVAGAPETGAHANNLSKLSVAISAFQDDLTRMGKDQLVTGMTFSEFGRRVISNASTGTDHGSGAPVIFFGSGVNGGITGTSPNLPTNPTGSTQVPTQYDFRQLYASVLQSWMCMSTAQSQTILNGNFSTLGIFAAAPLPIGGITLSAAWARNEARLSFTVHENGQYDEFRVERSVDAQTFTQIGRLPNNSLSTVEVYNFSDERRNAPEVFYRVRALTKQGIDSYSNTVRLSNGEERQVLSVYPNPVTDHTIHIDFFRDISEYVTVALYDMEGNKLFYDQQKPQGNQLVLKVPDYFQSHTLYLLRISYGFTEVQEKITFA